MAVIPGVLGCRPLRRTVQVRLGFDLGFRISDLGFLSTIDDIKLTVQISPFVLWFPRALSKFSIRIPQSAFSNRQPGGTTIFMVSRQQFMKYPG
jgi:3-hydroxymyristoyl/3-hydroxydecanoyl-(acyl carrier protein) dehydratase